MKIILNSPGFRGKSIYFSDNSVKAEHNKDISWFKNGQRHRENDLPACINDRMTSYWKNGIISRDKNQPAIFMNKYKSAKIYAKDGKWDIRHDTSFLTFIGWIIFFMIIIFLIYAFFQ